MKKNTLSLLLPTLAVLMPSAAMAHTGNHSASGFISGTVHPFVGLDHLLAIAAVGIVAAQQGGRSAHTLLGTFLGCMLIGAVAGLMGFALPQVEAGILASVMILGLMATTAVRLPTRVGAALMALFALMHGQAHGSEIPAEGSAIAYFAGFILATGLILATARYSADKLLPSKGYLANRLAGAGILLGGIAMVAA